MDFLDKELEKNKKYRDLIYKELDKDKLNFIKKIRSGLGEEIISEYQEKRQKNKLTFWQKLKKIFR